MPSRTTSSPVDSIDGSAPSEADASAVQEAAEGARTQAHSDSAMDRLARRMLGLRDAEPRALLDLQGSLVVSAVRCILAYVVIPIALPLVAWADVVARPLSLVLSLLAVGLSVRSLRRVWQANWNHRWAYTAFIALVVVLLAITIVIDVRILLG